RVLQPPGEVGDVHDVVVARQPAIGSPDIDAARGVGAAEELADLEGELRLVPEPPDHPYALLRRRRPRSAAGSRGRGAEARRTISRVAGLRQRLARPYPPLRALQLRGRRCSVHSVAVGAASQHAEFFQVLGVQVGSQGLPGAGLSTEAAIL